MKVKIDNSKSMLVFTPESPDDELSLEAFATKFKTDNYMIYCRGFHYMREEVEFGFQKMSGRD